MTFGLEMTIRAENQDIIETFAPHAGVVQMVKMKAPHRTLGALSSVLTSAVLAAKV